MGVGEERLHLFGIRHHGPGSARSLKAALEALQPDLVLVEGPPEANSLLPLALSADMHPPVALLIYAPENPAFAAYYPFAEYSPEWQAIGYALRAGVPARLFDLPQGVQMALQKRLAEENAPAAETDPATDGEGSDLAPTAILNPGDPLRALAEAAGYSESEQWWEHLVEQYRGAGRQNGAGELFAAILEAMTALREAAPPETHPIAARREAAMRQSIRLALREDFHRIAVVCGAWHAPVLTCLDEEKEDARLLKGLTQIKVQATWVPWTNARLTRQSGYGAGIDSPGWYSHLWHTHTDIATRWMIHTARLLRAEDLDISPAHVIEAVRLAEGLAALRGRPLPGLPELNEAALTVFCFGNPAPMRLIEEKLVVGDRLGSVPPETPMAPLQQDFERETRRLRLIPEAREKLLDLDLRKPFDLDRSRLLHRLRLLAIPWGRNDSAALQASGRGRSGTFHELWKLVWQPDFTVLLIEAGQWGNTIETAAAAWVQWSAEQAQDLVELTRLVENTLLAELPGAVGRLMACLQAQAAVSSDVHRLMEALPPLVSVLRYGNVRQTDTAMIDDVVDGLVARICIGLPSASSGLDDDAARELLERIEPVEDALARLADAPHLLAWRRTLAGLMDQPSVPGLLAGRACRILLDCAMVDHPEAARRLGLALSTANEPIQAAGWVEGFLRGSGQLLIHDPDLLGVLDGWLIRLPEAVFVQMLPLLRRTFTAFSRPERRSIGERLKRGPGQHPALRPNAEDFDLERANAALETAARLLGLR